MIVGNPNSGKRLATFALALLVLLSILVALTTLRKRTVPEKEPPLHPETIVLRTW